MTIIFAYTNLNIMNLRIKEVLDEKKISVADLAERLNVTRGACYNYINGNPTVEVLNKIASAINVDVTEFFTTSKEQKKIKHIDFFVRIDGQMYKINKQDFIDYIEKTNK